MNEPIKEEPFSASSGRTHVPPGHDAYFCIQLKATCVVEELVYVFSRSVNPEEVQIFAPVTEVKIQHLQSMVGVEPWRGNPIKAWVGSSVVCLFRVPDDAPHVVIEVIVRGKRQASEPSSATVTKTRVTP